VAAQVEIVGERETDRGWSFDAHVLDGDGAMSRHTVHVSWADYNHWSASGSDTPQAVASAVVGFLAGRAGPGGLQPAFDASLARRLHDDADTQIPRLIRDA
jgi:hypothetical protein